VGYLNSPLLSALYLAEGRPGWRATDELVRFETSADLGYALIAGKVDAAFVEPAKALLIKDIREFRQIDVLGKVTYPYGGILVVRRGLGLKLQDLPGHTVAISTPECRLYHTLRKDLARGHVDLARIRFEPIPFDEMLPALEAGVVDAAITRSSYGLVARELGHDVPYVQFDLVAGDACCLAPVAETEFLLLARTAARADAQRLAGLLLEAQKEGDADLRAAAHARTGLPLELLETYPAAKFAYADNLLLKLFLKAEEDERAEQAGGSAAPARAATAARPAAPGARP
jgi:ABC-type nitrate/sulfonate/bicarbonate transport system substrate-binding protein